MSYYVKGYLPPEFIKNEDDVKYYQRALGVKVDGIWGRRTQAAYDNWLSANSNNSGNGNSGKQSGYSWPKELPDSAEDWEIMSGYIREYLERSMRPMADAAIEAREKAAHANNAETDADAAARGMLGSTFVSSVKSRENSSAQTDIAGIEASYMSAVADKLYDALFAIQKQVLDERHYKYQAELDREKMDLEREKMERQYSSSSSRSRSASGSSETEYADDEFSDLVVPDLTYEQCSEMVDLLGDEALDLFYSDTDYWRRCRAELRAALGEDGFMSLYNEYMAKNVKGGTPTAHGSSKNKNREMIA